MINEGRMAGTKKQADDDILDLTDLIMVGATQIENVGVASQMSKPSPPVEANISSDDVLDNMVEEFEQSKQAGPAKAAAEKPQSSDALDMSNLDDLLGSLNLEDDTDDTDGFDEDNSLPDLDEILGNENSSDVSRDVPDSFDEDDDVPAPSKKKAQTSPLDALDLSVLDLPSELQGIDDDLTSMAADILNEHSPQQTAKKAPVAEAVAEKKPVAEAVAEKKPVAEAVAEKKSVADKNIVDNTIADLSFDAVEEKTPPAKVAPKQANPVSASPVNDADVDADDDLFLGNIEDTNSTGTSPETSMSGNAAFERSEPEAASVNNQSSSKNNRLSKMSDEMGADNYNRMRIENVLDDFSNKTTSSLGVLQVSVNKIVVQVSSLEAQMSTKHADDSTAYKEIAEKFEKQTTSLDDRLMQLEEVFAEQKTLNEQFSGVIEAQSAASLEEDSLRVEFEKIRQELTEAVERITSLENNMERDVTLATAKILKEEIIPFIINNIAKT